MAKRKYEGVEVNSAEPLKRITKLVRNFHSSSQLDSYKEYIIKSVPGYLGPYKKQGLHNSVGTGLQESEMKIIFGHKYKIGPTEFTSAVWDKIYAWYDTHIHTIMGASLVLDISLEKEGPLTVNNLPVKMDDYILYRFAVEHPSVASTEEDAINYGGSKTFYLEDINAITASNYSKTQRKLTALNLVVGTENDDMLRKALLTILELPMSSAQKEVTTLSEFADQNPERFLDVYNDSNLLLRSKIYTLIDHNLILKQGKIYTSKQGRPIADNLDELIAYYALEANSVELLSLEAELNSLMK